MEQLKLRIAAARFGVSLSTVAILLNLWYTSVPTGGLPQFVNTWILCERSGTVRMQGCCDTV